MDDLYLDIVVLPSGKVIVKDADELEDALVKGIIDKNLYDMAWNEVNKLKSLINKQNFELLSLSMDITK